MSTGLILLVLIGAIVAFGWTRLRGKMKLSVSGKHWLGPIVIVGLVLLLMWSSHTPATERAPGAAEPLPLRGISNQTALPSGVGLDPHRVASCSTR